MRSSPRCAGNIFPLSLERVRIAPSHPSKAKLLISIQSRPAWWRLRKKNGFIRASQSINLIPCWRRYSLSVIKNLCVPRGSTPAARQTGSRACLGARRSRCRFTQDPSSSGSHCGGRGSFSSQSSQSSAGVLSFCGLLQHKFSLCAPTPPLTQLACSISRPVPHTKPCARRRRGTAPRESRASLHGTRPPCSQEHGQR